MKSVQTKVDLLSFTLPEMSDWFVESGEKSFRAQQLYQWLYQSLETDFERMLNLPAGLRAKLAEHGVPGDVQVRREAVSKDERTRKVLLELDDGKLIESVLMLYPATKESRARASICVSTQAGCAFGCTFCATGQMGFDRHLTAGEIVAQVLFFARDLKAHPWTGPQGQVQSQVTNIIFMGMGEPLHNYDNVMKAIHILNDKRGFNLGARHMTVSTVGLAPEIRKLADEPFQINLAISLHAPNNAMRSQTMPVTKKYPIEEVFAACSEYIKKTGRQVTFEYVLLAGVNDGTEHARELGSILRQFRQYSHVNLIPVNSTSAGYQPPSGEKIRAFRDTLDVAGVSNSVRAERGDDIAAACGQLKTHESRLAINKNKRVQTLSEPS